MQQCLNNDISQCYNHLRRNPIYLLIWLLIFAIPIIFIPMAFICNKYFTCSTITIDILIMIGLILALSITTFVILPLILAFCLNGCFGIPQQPPPPLTNPPRHAFVPYRRYSIASDSV